MENVTIADVVEKSCYNTVLNLSTEISSRVVKDGKIFKMSPFSKDYRAVAYGTVRYRTVHVLYYSTYYVRYGTVAETYGTSQYGTWYG